MRKYLIAGMVVSPVSEPLVWWGLGDSSEDLGAFWEKDFTNHRLYY